MKHFFSFFLFSRVLQSVVHGEYEFQPGYFECDKVWQYDIPIHSRLWSNTPNTGQSIAMNTVRLVLHHLKVTNRQNIFVIKEQEGQDENVVYVRYVVYPCLFCLLFLFVKLKG